MEYSLLIFSAVPGAAAPQLLHEGREAGRVPKARPKTQGPRETQEPEVFRLLFGSILVWAASIPAIPNNSRIGTSSKNDQ